MILGEIKKARQHNKRIVKHIIEQAKRNYFKSVAGDSGKALEDALQKINFSLSETLSQTKKEWLQCSNIVIAACQNREVHFAKIGHINVFLVSKKDIVNIAQGSGEEEVNPVKAFANIYSGKVPRSSAILFLTENILDYVSQEKLKRLINQNSSSAALLELKSLLKPAPGTQTFGALLIKRSSTDQSEAKPIKLGIVKSASLSGAPKQKKKAAVNKFPSHANRLSQRKRSIPRVFSKILAAKVKQLS